MNIHLPQSLTAMAEVKELLTMNENFISSQDCKPLVTIKQDTMTGVYKLTYGKVKISKEIFYDVLTWFELNKCLKKLDKIKEFYKRNVTNKPPVTVKKTIERKIELSLEDRVELEELQEEIRHLRQLQRRAKTEATVQKHQKTIDDIQTKIDVIISKEKTVTEEVYELCENSTYDDPTCELSDDELYTGHNLFSCILPDDFEYVCDNKMSPDEKPVVVTEGILISGTLNKEALGNISGSLIHHIAKDYGNSFAADFLSDLQILINAWFQHYGFTVGLEDFIPKNSETGDKEMNKCFMEAFSVMQTEKDPDILEIRVSSALNKAIGLGQKIAKGALTHNNNMVSMIRSGSKGNWYNISQVTGLVGQQNVNGRRLEKHFGGRTLSHFRRTGYLSQSPDTISTNIDINDHEKVLKETVKLFKSRGFVANSFYKGLDPEEYFFSAAGGREGLIDSACKTSMTGYLQRKITKVLEDLQTSYIGSVVTATNRVIQFSYGSDNLDTNKLIKTGNGLSFVHVDHLTSRLNKQFELASQ